MSNKSTRSEKAVEHGEYVFPISLADVETIQRGPGMFIEDWDSETMGFTVTTPNFISRAISTARHRNPTANVHLTTNIAPEDTKILTGTDKLRRIDLP